MKFQKNLTPARLFFSLGKILNLKKNVKDKASNGADQANGSPGRFKNANSRLSNDNGRWLCREHLDHVEIGDSS